MTNKALIGDLLPKITEVHNQITGLLTPDDCKKILGPRVAKFYQGGTGKTLVGLALLADALRLVHGAIVADGTISDTELEASTPFLTKAAKAFAKVRSSYQDFEAISADQLSAFVNQYSNDNGPFGYLNQETKWAGLQICSNADTIQSEPSMLTTFRDTLLKTARRLIGTDGASSTEEEYLEDLEEQLRLIQAAKLPASMDSETAPGLAGERFYLEFRPGTGRLQLQCDDRVVITYSHSGWYNNASAGLDFRILEDGEEGIKDENAEISPRLFSSIMKFLRVQVEDALNQLSIAHVPRLEELDLRKAIAGREISWEEVIDRCGNPRNASYVTRGEWVAAVSEGRAVTIVPVSETDQIGLVGSFPDGWERLVFEVVLPIEDGLIIGYDESDVTEEHSDAQIDQEHATERLFDAVEACDLEAVVAALDEGADLNHQHDERNGNTPLLVAIEKGHSHIVQVLLERAADLSITNWEDQLDPWLKACIIGNHEIMSLLAEHGAEAKLENALDYAATKGILALAKRVLEQGANPEGGKYGTPPLLKAAQNGHAEIIDLLVENQANLHAEENGENAYVAAFSRGYSDLAERLATLGCTADATYSLIHTARMHNIDGLKKILSEGVDVNVRRKVHFDETTAIEQAIDSFEFLPNSDGQEDVLVFQTVLTLLENGADPDTKTSDGDTVLQLAIKRNRALAAGELIRKNADTGPGSDEQGRNAFLLAVLEGDKKTVAQVGLNGIDVQHCDAEGNNALNRYLLEKEYVDLDLIKTLVALGVSYRQTNGIGQTAADLCKLKQEEFNDTDEYQAERFGEAATFIASEECDQLLGILFETNFTDESFQEKLRALVQLAEDREAAEKLIAEASSSGVESEKTLVELLNNEDPDLKLFAVAMLEQTGFQSQTAESLMEAYESVWQDELKEGIRRALANNGFATPVDPAALEEIDEATAERIVATVAPGEWILLDNLTDISTAAAEVLVQSPCNISLDGLNSLTKEAASVLYEHKAALSLNGLSELDETIAGYLAGHCGGLYLNGVMTLEPEIAKLLANSPGSLSLNGLRTLSTAVAALLANHKGKTLSLDGLVELDPDSASSLSAFNGELWLDGLKEASDEVIQALSAHQGDLTLNGLESLSVAAVKALSEHKGSLYLNGLTTLPDEIAFHLAKHKGFLSMDGLRDVSVAGAKAFLGSEATVAISTDELPSDIRAIFLTQNFLENPITNDLLEGQLSEIESEQDMVLDMVNSQLDTEPEALTGVERIEVGRRYALKMHLEKEKDPDAAIADGRLAVRFNPSTDDGEWAELAALQSLQGDSTLQAALDCYGEGCECNDWQESQASYEKAIAVCPEFPWSYNNIAWHLATAANQDERDGEEAVRLSIKVCESDGYNYWCFLDTLAAAYAEKGDFENAVQMAEKAVSNCPGCRIELLELLDRYRSRQAYPIERENAPT